MHDYILYMRMSRTVLCVVGVFQAFSGGIRIILPSTQRVDLAHVSYLIIKYHQIPRTIFIADKIPCSCSCHAQKKGRFSIACEDFCVRL